MRQRRDTRSTEAAGKQGNGGEERLHRAPERFQLRRRSHRCQPDATPRDRNQGQRAGEYGSWSRWLAHVSSSSSSYISSSDDAWPRTASRPRLYASMAFAERVVPRPLRRLLRRVGASPPGGHGVTNDVRRGCHGGAGRGWEFTTLSQDNGRENGEDGGSLRGKASRAGRTREEKAEGRGGASAKGRVRLTTSTRHHVFCIHPGLEGECLSRPKTNRRCCADSAMRSLSRSAESARLSQHDALCLAYWYSQSSCSPGQVCSCGWCGVCAGEEDMFINSHVHCITASLLVQCICLIQMAALFWRASP